MPEEKTFITCTHCGNIWDKQVLDKSCSNCFACTGCEAYVCAECRYEIVVVPAKPMNMKRQ